MKKFYIVVESGADLDEEMIKRYDIRVGAMHVALGHTDYLDGTLSLEELCGFYDKSGKLPQTSAVSPYQYAELFKEIRAENPDSVIIHIGYSKVLSSSFHNAEIASENFDEIYHIDSKNVSMGFGVLVLQAAQLIERRPNISTEELLDFIEETAKKTKFWFVPGSLKYLKAGGRVSNAKALFSTIFNIKPLLELVDGKMIATSIYTGSISKVAIKVLKDFYRKNELSIKTMYLGYTVTIEPELKLALEELAREYGAQNIVWFKAGAVITTHAGPGGIGIAGIEI